MILVNLMGLYHGTGYLGTGLICSGYEGCISKFLRPLEFLDGHIAQNYTLASPSFAPHWTLLLVCSVYLITSHRFVIGVLQQHDPVLASGHLPRGNGGDGRCVPLQ